MLSKITSVFIAAWFPSEKKPSLGVFIEEHAHSAALFSNVYAVNLVFTKSKISTKINITELKKGELNIINISVFSPLRRFGIHDYLVKRAYAKALLLIQQRNNIDVVHINVRDKYTKLVCDVKLLKNVPIIVTEHSSFYHTGILKLNANEQNTEVRNINKWFANPDIKKVLPVSNELASILVNRYGVLEDKIKIIPNVSNPCFVYSPIKKGEKIRVLLVANWQEPKNPFIFLKMLKDNIKELNEQIIIDWVGEGKQIREIKEFASTFLEEYKINFHGFKTKKFISRLFNQSDFFVHPTDAENLPTVIIESLCSGIPVLSHNVNGIPELINKTNGILCQVKSESAMKQGFFAMLKLCRGYDNKQISKDALMLFSQKAISEEIKSVYKSILPKSKSSLL